MPAARHQLRRGATTRRWRRKTNCSLTLERDADRCGKHIPSLRKPAREPSEDRRIGVRSSGAFLSSSSHRSWMTALAPLVHTRRIALNRRQANPAWMLLWNRPSRALTWADRRLSAMYWSGVPLPSLKSRIGLWDGYPRALNAMLRWKTRPSAHGSTNRMRQAMTPNHRFCDQTPLR
jgi:hypothetical protein